jgi:hypothetical protein
MIYKLGAGIVSRGTVPGREPDLLGWVVGLFSLAGISFLDARRRAMAHADLSIDWIGGAE